MPAMPLLDQWSSLDCPVIGMVHLAALPGAPAFAGDLQAVTRSAVADARALAAGGADGLMIENFNDVPFYKDDVPAHTVAAMTYLAQAICDAVDLPLGINVLRNDVCSALAIASVVGAAYVRVNVLSGAAVTDQGLIEGRAAQVMRYRQQLGAQNIKVLADVRVKHAAALAPRPLQDEVEELIHRAGADAVIVSGTGTGKPVDLDELARVKQIAGDIPVLVGSGVSASTAAALCEYADGLIVGTWVKQDGQLDRPVDDARVRELVQAVRSV